ncbi:MAG: hypothetical protein QM778_36445 [Myxococcales bacterium]
MSMANQLGRLARDRRGLSTVEYVLLLVLIAAGSIRAWQQFGSALIQKVDAQKTAIQGLGSGGGGGGGLGGLPLPGGP